jgi:hypothetical protein
LPGKVDKQLNTDDRSPTALCQEPCVDGLKPLLDLFVIPRSLGSLSMMPVAGVDRLTGRMAPVAPLMTAMSSWRRRALKTMYGVPV